jgi:ATP synthase protein I
MAIKPLSKLIQNEAYRIVFWQLVCVLLLALCTLIVSSSRNSLSVFAGGLAYGLPNLFFVWRVFRFAGAQEINRFMVAFFAGEAFKLIFSAILFLVIVKYLPVSLLSTLVGFVGAIVSFWIVCMWHFSRQKSK